MYNIIDSTPLGDLPWESFSLAYNGDVPKGNALQLEHSQDLIAKDPGTHGSMFVPIVLGSDKTTVSVATGHCDRDEPLK